MRVRKVDSDAIELYESSQVKFKTTGTMREVQFSAGVNKSCVIQNISKDTYLDKPTVASVSEKNIYTEEYLGVLLDYAGKCYHRWLERNLPRHS